MEAHSRYYTKVACVQMPVGMTLMKLVTNAKKIAALTIAATLVIVGCGGSGGGSSLTSGTDGGAVGAQAAQVIKNNGAFMGTLGATSSAAKGRGAPAETTLSVRFDGALGEAAFKAGSFGSPDFLTYSADITNLVITPDAAGDTGTVSFDMGNFTAGAPYQSLHWTGNYQWNKAQGSGAAVTLTGNVTGTLSDGGPVNSSFTLTYKHYANVVSFTGDWAGDISLPGTANPVAWTGSFTESEAGPISVSISYGGHTIAVPAITTNFALAGSFDASALAPGAVGQLYMERDPAFNDDSHLIGGYTVSQGGTVTATGVIHAARVVALAPGAYKGTFIPEGGTPKQLTLDLLHLGSTPGVYGAALFEQQNGPNFGGRIEAVRVNGLSTSVDIAYETATQVSPTLLAVYGSIELKGSPTVTGFSGTYRALFGNTVETGTFTTTKQTDFAHPSVQGAWSGTAREQSGTGPATAFSGTITQTEDQFVFTVTQSVEGNVTTFPVNGYLVGNKIVGDVHTGATINGIPSSYGAQYEGTISADGTQITGKFTNIIAPENSAGYSDNGTFTLTKQ